MYLLERPRQLPEPTDNVPLHRRRLERRDNTDGQQCRQHKEKRPKISTTDENIDKSDRKMEPSELASVTSTGSVRKRAPSKRGETMPTQSTTTAATPITSQSEKKRLARLSRLYYDDFVTLDTTIMLKTYVRYIAKNYCVCKPPSMIVVGFR
ncbi:hypothetical protein ZHAS_00013375 [Anopheles sinensis]|uniref:Uncharacterized protein n=1 Tax=Anopheles sinensis TaxID=74873 RepID=A0A084W5E7_ANOSI|nr:hypothetical protein ZHAS_00013375 [Anopheles sinensis]